MPLSFVIPNLLTWDGTRPVVGGLERLAWALISMTKRAGYPVDVHQFASEDWEREVDGVSVRGHGLARLSTLAAMESIHHETTACLYLSILQEPIVHRPDSLVVSHGVWWDTPGMRVQSMFDLCKTVLQQSRTVVSVDYNFLNVMRAAYPDLATKITVIPNFVDTDRFAPPTARPQPTTILFPRRVDPARGLELFLAAVEPVLALDDSLRVWLSVDQNLESDFASVHQQLKTMPHPERVKVMSTPFDQMPVLYREADIVVIPSTYSEGTSMACLEAMASGCAVIASDVGGLTNLILSEFNGLLVPPRTNAFARALSHLVRNPSLRAEMGEHARMSALAFGRARWETAWTDALRRVYGPPTGGLRDA